MQVCALLQLVPGATWDRDMLTTAQEPGKGPQLQPAAKSSAVPDVLTLADMRAHCRQQGLAAYKAPHFCRGSQEALPVNASRKVSRSAVCALLQRHHDPISKL